MCRMIKRLGILGGGQLAQMLTQAAVSLGLETAIFERAPDSPAARLTHHHVVGDWQDTGLLERFAQMCDVVTLENEFVDVGVLRVLAAQGVPVFPTAETLSRIQDKFVQKQTMQAAGVPLPPFAAVETFEHAIAFAEVHGWPVVLKARRDGYDGYGNATLRTPAEAESAFARFAGRELMVEAFVPFRRELAVMVLRGRDGSVMCYPVVETIQQNHICHVVRAPAPIDPGAAVKARDLAVQAVEAVNGVGVFGVELFQLANGDVLYNEIAPRPHNSGHYTIEGCVTSQFENHIRAVMGWPLGSTEVVRPAAVMVNLLGQRAGEVDGEGIREALMLPEAHMHVYGKRDVRPGRKLGHITVLGDTLEHAEDIARRAAAQVRL